MQAVLILLASVIALLIVGRVLARRSTAGDERFQQPPRPPRMAQAEVVEELEEFEEVAEGIPPRAPTVPSAPDEGAQAELYEVAHQLLALYQKLAHPSELLAHPTFATGLQCLTRVATTGDAVLDYVLGENMPIACLALETLAQRNEPTPVEERKVRRRLLDHISDVHPWTRYFGLRVLDARSTEPVVADLLLALRPGWEEIPLALQSLDAFLESRVARETVDLAPRIEAISVDQSEFIAGILRRLDSSAAEGLAKSIRGALAERVDLGLLATIGRVRERTSGVVVEHPAIVELVDLLHGEIVGDAPRPQVLVGEHGVGKSTVLRQLGARLDDEGWVLFEAGASELVAGQRYLGDLESRIRELTGALAAPRRVVWIIPDLAQMLRAGTHEHSRVGALRLLTPYLLEGRLRIVAEATPGGYERVLNQEPGIASIVDVHRLAPLDTTETLELVRRWAQLKQARGGSRIPDGVLDEASRLADQYFSNQSRPGSLFDLLQNTVARAERAGPSRVIEMEDVVTSVSRLTGLPRDVLDDRERLDLSVLRERFETRVVAQPEAVDCLVRRIAMIKAGVTDPTRPLGVFLFAGPTGTGKTELAKALAEYLFGSADRMIRLDMSEFRTADAMGRLLASSSTESRRPGGGSIIDRVREQPFSLLLLDEFEKASPPVWDLFLQLFDDGRLTDWSGNTADFRHTIVIMTSNLGAATSEGSRLGFTHKGDGFRAESVERVIDETFRPEFLNRIDQVVIFRPLSRAIMRQLLEKELAEATRRRGLRSRQWALEWDESALEFLLDRGFTETLGARPLRRAVERHLLAPLAETIVQHEFPEGDQFLFVRADGDRLGVDFIDPNAPVGPPTEPADAGPAKRVTLASIMHHGNADPEVLTFLRESHRRLDQEMTDGGWRARKDEDIAAMSRPGFWEDEDRFVALGRAEYVDRLETGLSTAGSLLERLSQTGGARERTHFPVSLVQRLAQQLYLLQTALRGLAEGKPRDAYVLVESSRDPQAPRESGEFARQIATMLLRWGKKRGMRLTVLEESGPAAAGNGPAGTSGPSLAGARDLYRVLLSVSGYGAFVLLEREDGIHVLEVPGKEDWKSGTRVRVRVRVAPQPENEPLPTAVQKRRERAHQAFGQNDTAPVVVRHYRDEPSPLVRDSVAGWKTGRLDLVLGGDFDLMPQLASDG